MLKLSEQVLSKIEDLLVEIDKPNTKKLKKTKVNKPNEQDKKGNRLYQQHINKIHRQKQVERNKVYSQLQMVKPFKVSNKHSIFLNSQTPKKPIYERAQDIRYQKQKLILEKKIQNAKAKQLERQKQEEQITKIQMEKNKRKFNEKQLNQHVQQLEKQNLDRLNHLNMRKLEQFRKNTLKMQQVPELNKTSQSIWEKSKIKKSISTNILKRFQQYDWEQKRRREDFIKNRQKTQTPFSPIISSKSRIIAQKSERSPLTKELQRSISCKCFKKRDLSKSASTFVNSSRYRKQYNKKNDKKYELNFI